MLAGTILALLFLAAVWAIVLVFAMPSWIAILATAFVLFGAAAFLVWGRLRARAASREIERSLGQQADAHAQAVRPDQQAEIEAMRGEFQKAVRSLKTSKLAKGGTDALAVLPWYMIIGPPGAGKSTALRASGLKFPFLSARGGGVKGVGGTRNCEWWLTNEAVILDTAGRYATEEDDRDEWLGFLDVLLRTRPRKPINGLIVAVSVADIGGWPEEGVVDLAKGLRDRVDEVMSRLQIVLPTYLLFTKADLMPGFVETFGDLRKNERGQIWGFTLAQGATAEQRAGIYQEHFDELLACVEERALQRIGEERQLAARERIHGFPQQFGALRSNLATFVEHLFAENVYQDTPALRGVYFTSGTQEGRTIDRVMSAMAEAFGMAPAAGTPEPVVEVKSYFLRDVFAKVMFPDKNLAARNAKAERRLVVTRTAMAAGCAAVALLGL
ncbi:MAG: type VI secretion system membrane subunit TssM, partial [Myxococcales bacterium]